MQFRMKPDAMTSDVKTGTDIEAVRYGKILTGVWFDGAAQRVAQFMLGLGPDGQPSEHEALDVIQPDGLWNPPEYATLKMWGGVLTPAWHKLYVGDWVIKNQHGEYYPLQAYVFSRTYERVTPGLEEVSQNEGPSTD